MPLIMTVVRVVVDNVGVTDMFAKHRWRDLGSICRVLVRE
jgi:hypothetical protein